MPGNQYLHIFHVYILSKVKWEASLSKKHCLCLLLKYFTWYALYYRLSCMVGIFELLFMVFPLTQVYLLAFWCNAFKCSFQN